MKIKLFSIILISLMAAFLLANTSEFDYSELHAYLYDITQLDPDDSYFIVGDGTNWIRETGATVRTSLGLGTTDTLEINDVNIHNELRVWNDANIYGNLTLGGLLTIYQDSDTDGIRLYGHDDHNTDYLEFRINSAGNAIANSTGSLYFQTGGLSAFRVSSTSSYFYKPAFFADSVSLALDKKLYFNTVNEYILSDDANYMDYGATTEHRFNNDVNVGGELIVIDDANIGGALRVGELQVGQINIKDGTITGPGEEAYLHITNAGGISMDSPTLFQDNQVSGSAFLITGGAMYDVPIDAKAYGYLDLDGTGDYVDVPDNDTLDIIDDLTVAFWFQKDADDNENIICKGFTDDHRSWTVSTGNGHRIVFYATPDGSQASRGYSITDASAYSEDTWYHFIITFDAGAGTAVCYLNNSSITFTEAFALPNSLYSSDESLTIGYGINDYHTGYLDGVMVYDAVIDSTERAAIYNSGDRHLGSHDHTDLVSYWSFDNGTARDRKGTNHGTLEGTATIVEDYSGLSLKANGIERINILDDMIGITGNVGIGTADPDQELEVYGVSPIIRIRATGTIGNAAAYVEFGRTTDGDWVRTGYVGDAISGNEDIYIVAKVGDLKLGDSSNNAVLTLSGGDATFSGDLTVGGAISSATITVTTSSDALDVSNVNTVFINISGDIILGGLIGGVDGQILHFAIIGNFTNHVRFVHAGGIGGSQDFINHTAADEDIDNGGCVYVCNGTNWYDISHAKHI